MKTITNRLIEELNQFKGTNEEINTAEDLYEYTMFYWQDITNATMEECEDAINLVFNN